MTTQEKRILSYFKKEIFHIYPDEIIKIILFGSKARGDSSENSDMDILVIVKSSDWQLADKIRSVGYKLDEAIGYSLSIQVLSESYYTYLHENNFQFAQNVEKDGVPV